MTEWGFIISDVSYSMPLNDDIKRYLETIAELEYAYGPTRSRPKTNQIWQLISDASGIKWTRVDGHRIEHVKIIECPPKPEMVGKYGLLYHSPGVVRA